MVEWAREGLSYCNRLLVLLRILLFLWEVFIVIEFDELKLSVFIVVVLVNGVIVLFGCYDCLNLNWL